MHQPPTPLFLQHLLAYGLATAGIVSMITLYARSLLGSWRRVAPLAATLSLLYLYLLSLLGAEDYSLLLGAGGLFVILAAAMYLTRNLDWRTLSFDRGSRERRGGVAPRDGVLALSRRRLPRLTDETAPRFPPGPWIFEPAAAVAQWRGQ